jgi:hypothetical protein
MSQVQYGCDVGLKSLLRSICEWYNAKLSNFLKEESLTKLKLSCDLRFKMETKMFIQKEFTSN